MDAVQNNDFTIVLQKIGIVPSAFITGPMKSDEARKLLQLQWNIVFCIGGDENSLLNNAKDRISFIKHSEDFIQENNQENIPVFSKDKFPLVVFNPDPLEGNDIKLRTLKKLALKRTLQGILSASGLIFIQDIPTEYYEYLYDITSEFPRWYDVFIFGSQPGGKADEYIKQWKKDKRVLLSAKLLQTYWDDDLATSRQEDSESLFINSKLYSIPSQALEYIRHFGQLLTQETADEIPFISKADEPTFFQFFLERSTGGFPNWYWYSQNTGFSVKRIIKDDIIRVTRDALESAKSKERKGKPILLQGRSFSGKTNILCSVAYHFFSERKYPVIYMPNMGATVNLQSIYSGTIFILKTLEKAVGIKVPVLLVWDTACKQINEYKEIINFRTDLRWSGWQVELLCSGYNTDCYPEINQEVRKYFYPIQIKQKLDKQEINDFRKTLISKKAFSEYEFDNYIRKLAEEADSDFLGYLYQFRRFHPMLRRHVAKETDSDIDSLKKVFCDCIKESLKKQLVGTLASFSKEIEKLDQFVKDHFPEENEKNTDEQKNDKEVVTEAERGLRKTLGVVALCTIYSCSVSNELFVRILTKSEKMNIPTWPLYRLCTQNNILRELPTEPVSYQFRSALDAKLFLPANDEVGTGFTQFQLVLDLINAVSNEREVDLLIILLKQSGPNPNRNIVLNDEKNIWEKHIDEYPKIWNALAQQRKKKRFFEKVLPLEKSLIREWYRAKWKDISDDKEEATAFEELMNAKKELHDVYFDLKKHNDDWSYDYRSKVLVEYVNFLLFISEKFPTEVDLEFHFEQLQHDFVECYNYNKCGKVDSYIPVNYLKLGGRYYDSIPQDDLEKRLALLSYLLQFAAITSADSTDNYLTKEIALIESKADEFNKNDDFLIRSTAQGNPAAICVRVEQELRELESDNHKGYRKDAIKYLLDSYLENPQYQQVIDSDSACLYRLITLKWESITGLSSILPRNGEERIMIGLQPSEWTFFRNKCKLYSFLCKEQSFPHVFLIDYLYVLASVHLGIYTEEEAMLLDSRNKSESGRRSLYLICDEKKNPILFSGISFYHPEQRYGEVNVTTPENMKFKWVRYYNPWIVGLTDEACRKGKVPTGKEFHIALSRTGLKVDAEE